MLMMLLRVAHRNHASVCDCPIPSAVSGHLMEEEITHLNQAFSKVRPAVWLMGGAKVG